MFSFTSPFYIPPLLHLSCFTHPSLPSLIFCLNCLLIYFLVLFSFISSSPCVSSTFPLLHLPPSPINLSSVIFYPLHFPLSSYSFPFLLLLHIPFSISQHHLFNSFFMFLSFIFLLLPSTLPVLHYSSCISLAFLSFLYSFTLSISLLNSSTLLLIH